MSLYTTVQKLGLFNNICLKLIPVKLKNPVKSQFAQYIDTVKKCLISAKPEVWCDIKINGCFKFSFAITGINYFLNINK